MFQESLQTLKIAKTKFEGSKDALEQVGDDWKEKEILVPLTGSMYVKGVVNNIDKFVIDVGTGYYAEKVSSDNRFACECRKLNSNSSISGPAHVERLLQAEDRLRARADGQNRHARPAEVESIERGN